MSFNRVPKGKKTYAVNRFKIPDHCSLELRVLGITCKLRWKIAGTISKRVELHNIYLISKSLTPNELAINSLLGVREFGRGGRDKPPPPRALEEI